MGEFSKLVKGSAGYIQRMREASIYADGALPAKVKALAAMLWGISARCDPCIKFYAAKAKELGATEHEIGEFLAVASTMGGCVGEMWALKAYSAVRNGSAEAEQCCT